MKRQDAERFAAEWIERWNARDVEGVLAHYHDDLVFRSPKAAAIVGQGELQGKEALRAYWREALTRITSLRFTLDYVLWDEDRAQVGVVYVAELNGQRTRAC